MKLLHEMAFCEIEDLVNRKTGIVIVNQVNQETEVNRGTQIDGRLLDIGGRLRRDHVRGSTGERVVGREIGLGSDREIGWYRPRSIEGGVPAIRP
jgi:hypothetical protein